MGNISTKIVVTAMALVFGTASMAPAWNGHRGNAGRPQPARQVQPVQHPRMQTMNPSHFSRPQNNGANSERRVSRPHDWSSNAGKQSLLKERERVPGRQIGQSGATKPSKSDFGDAKTRLDGLAQKLNNDKKLGQMKPGDLNKMKVASIARNPVDGKNSAAVAPKVDPLKLTNTNNRKNQAEINALKNKMAQEKDPKKRAELAGKLAALEKNNAGKNNLAGSKVGGKDKTDPKKAAKAYYSENNPYGADANQKEAAFEKSYKDCQAALEKWKSDKSIANADAATAAIKARNDAYAQWQTSKNLAEPWEQGHSTNGMGFMPTGGSGFVPNGGGGFDPGSMMTSIPGAMGGGAGGGGGMSGDSGGGGYGGDSGDYDSSSPAPRPRVASNSSQSYEPLREKCDAQKKLSEVTGLIAQLTEKQQAMKDGSGDSAAVEKLVKTIVSTLEEAEECGGSNKQVKAMIGDLYKVVEKILAQSTTDDVSKPGVRG
jgi:hypothetical protein